MEGLFSWHFCLLGPIQVTALFAKFTTDGYYPFATVLSPSICYLVIEILKQLKKLQDSQDIPTDNAGVSIVNITSMCLALASMLLFLEGHALEESTYYEVIIPLYAMFGLQIAFKAIYDKPQWLGPVFNLITPAMSVCSTTGACSSFYLSTLSSLLSALGVSISDLVSILAPFTLLLLGINLSSIYYTKKSLKYPPFLLALSCSFVILYCQYYHLTRYVLFANIGLVGAVLWNNILIKRETGQFVKIL